MAVPLALFRCDASAVIGAGHAMRCLALAEVLEEVGWRIGFAVGKETIEMVPALAASGFNVCVLSDADHEPEAIREQASGRADLLVVDHYKRDAVFESSCRAFAHKILVLDDATGRSHDCNILVDAAAESARSYAGHVPGRAQVLAGPAYALVRRSFVAGREAALARRDGRPVKEILVSCGATDPGNATGAVLEALDHVVDDIAVTVVLSSRAPHIDAVRKRLRGKARLLLDVEKMADLMTNADLAIGASGSTAYERAVLGLPSIMLTVADNQRGIARQMTEAEAGVDGGIAGKAISARLRRLTGTLLADGAARRRMAEAASTLVDGRGAVRIVLAMLDSETATNRTRVRLRLAVPNDELWLLNIQQHPRTRRYFRNPSVPTIGEHRDWMRRTLADPERLLLIAEADGNPVGSVRLDRLPDLGGSIRQEVAITVDPERQNWGIGAAALRLVRALMPGAVLDATVLPDNKASQALFAGAGFAAVSGNIYRCNPSRMLS